MYCPNCGNQVSAGAAFCGHCGERLFSQEPPLPEPSRLPLWLLLIPLLLTCLTGAAGIAGYYYYYAPLREVRLLPGSSRLAAENTPTHAGTAAGDVAAPTFTATAVLLQPTFTPSAINPGANPESNQPTPSLLPTKTSTPTPVPTAIATATATSSPTATRDAQPETTIIGYSVRQIPIEAVRFGTGPNVIVLIGGLHAGFAPGSVTLADRAHEYLSQNPQEVPANVTLFLILNANPDSAYNPGELSGRLNANSVDLNRNWDCRWTANPRWRNVTYRGMGGTAPLSEPETRALANLIQAQSPKAVVFWQAMATGGLASPGSCGSRSQVSESLARVYGLAAGYRVADFEQITNQQINGDVTNWLAGQGIPAISVLLPTHSTADWDNNRRAIVAVLQAYSR
jgi:hypothetical protein